MLASLAACALVVQLVQSPPPALAAMPTALVTAPTIQAQPRPSALTSLYVSFAALQGLDVHSTTRAITSGAGREANPAMRWIVGNPAGLIAVKGAATGTIIWMTEKIRRKHPRAAIIFMAAINSTMAAIVARNYAVP